MKSNYNQTFSELKNNLFEFTAKDIQEIHKKEGYNLRIKKFSTYENEKNCCYNYYKHSSKNNSIIFRNENDLSSPQQQISSTASSNYKNVFTLLDEYADNNKATPSNFKYSKRKRNAEDNIYFEQYNLKNKKAKLF